MPEPLAEGDTMNSAPKPVWERCWCWQFGRCLVDCPTADLTRPSPFTDATWRDAALAAMRATR